ncbi:MAG TPA: hypothetical protein VFK74_00795 [Azospira sp.]|nr:hypothetical protein [Azospira sp.]
MDTSRWSKFFGTGALVMPPFMGFGTDSMESFAVTELVMLLLLVMAVAWEQIAREAAESEGEGDGDH